MNDPKYPVIIEALTNKDGGGYFAKLPDLPGCMADGATPIEALANAEAAKDAWLDCQARMGRPIPKPTSFL